MVAQVTTTLLRLLCACVHVMRKQRVETYLHPDTIAQLEHNYDKPVSELVRDAVTTMLEADANE